MPIFSKNGSVNKSGDTMTGPLNLPTDGLDIGNGQFKISDGGIATNPNRPFFRATGVGGPDYIPQGRMTFFSNVESNVGGHFDPSTQQFTAPVDGVYLFNMSVINWGYDDSAAQGGSERLLMLMSLSPSWYFASFGNGKAVIETHTLLLPIKKGFWVAPHVQYGNEAKLYRDRCFYTGVLIS